MKAARLIVLGVALVAGGGAAYLMMGNKEPPPPVQLAAPPPATEDVLVAAHDINPGTPLTDADMRWAQSPKSLVPGGGITRSVEPTAIHDLVGLYTRTENFAGDPIRRERLAKDSGYMAAVLPTGSRAVAIDLADQGKSAAGGFILPNDRVDVIRTFHPEDAPGAFASETILTNVRVLAIGQSVQEKAGERTVIGGTATLELTPEQAEKVILAQRTGQLTLSLRSMADATKTEAVKPAELSQTMTIIRYGNTSQSRVH